MAAKKKHQQGRRANQQMIRVGRDVSGSLTNIGRDMIQGDLVHGGSYRAQQMGKAIEMEGRWKDDLAGVGAEFGWTEEMIGIAGEIGTPS